MTRRNINFDYPDTCPKIDKVLWNIEGKLHAFVTELLVEVCPYLTTDIVRQLADEHSGYIQSMIDDEVESLRNLNADMRAEADAQIGILKEEIFQLENA